MPSESTDPGSGDRPWWMSAVCYEGYLRSFADSDGEGQGDLAGVRAHLDHLEWLGIDALRLCPFYPSPMADNGYDIADFCGVDPVFGSLAELDRLVHGFSTAAEDDWIRPPSDPRPGPEETVAGQQYRDDSLWSDVRRASHPPGCTTTCEAQVDRRRCRWVSSEVTTCMPDGWEDASSTTNRETSLSR